MKGLCDSFCVYAEQFGFFSGFLPKLFLLYQNFYCKRDAVLIGETESSKTKCFSIGSKGKDFM